MLIHGQDFYVYLHRRADDGQVFYVGKGTRRRAWERRRSLYWRNVEAKHGLIVDIVFRGSEAECFACEIAEIARQRSYGAPLVNLTDGGEGCSNPAPSVTAKRSATLSASWANPEVRARRLLALRASTATADFSQKARAAGIAATASPERRKTISRVSKANWADPGYRQRVVDAQVARFASREARIVHGELTRQALADPAIRARLSAGVKAALGRPETKAKQAARMRRRNTDADPMVGVDQRGASFRARIKHGQRNITVGSFTSLEAAQAARREAERKYWEYVR